MAAGWYTEQKRTAICPVCRQDKELRSDGLIIGHRATDSNYHPERRSRGCEGSYQPPLQADIVVVQVQDDVFEDPTRARAAAQDPGSPLVLTAREDGAYGYEWRPGDPERRSDGRHRGTETGRRARLASQQDAAGDLPAGSGQAASAQP